MSGMDRNTGKLIEGWDHVVQCLNEAWTTPKLTRAFRRHLGTGLPDILDRPASYDVTLELVLAIGETEQWEPRFQLIQALLVSGGADGVFEVEIWGYHFPFGHKGDFSVFEQVNGHRVRIIG